MKSLSFAVLSVLSLAASSAFAAGGCPADKAENLIKELTTKCQLSNSDAKRIRDNAAICKTYANHYKIVVLDRTSDVAVVDTQTCGRRRFDVDSSGIKEMVIDGGFAYMFSNDGELYLLDAKASIYEVNSNSGRPYGFKNGGAAVLDIKGTGGKGAAVSVTLNNGQTFALNPNEVIFNRNRWTLLPAQVPATGMSIFNDKTVR